MTNHPNPKASHTPKALLAIAVVLLCLLAGCADPDKPTRLPVQETDSLADADGQRQVDDGIHLHGHAVTQSLVPIAGANVSLIAPHVSVVTDENGAFDFGRLPARIYSLQARAAGFNDAWITITPEQRDSEILIVLEVGQPVIAYNVTMRFRGNIQCALEVLIISPSCDSIVAGANDELEANGGGRPLPLVFDQNQSFLFQADLGWRTLVLDVLFDGEAQPGLVGLRTVLRGTLDHDGGGEYVQYGRWHNESSYSVRVEPGNAYMDGVEPVPFNATGFQLDVYPQGHLYHEVCGGETCFLGAGLGTDVQFQVFATLFYVDPAPPGFKFS